MTTNNTPTIRKPNEGRTIAVVGDVYRFMATGEDTNGKYAMWEAIVPPGGGPPPHVHSREEESFYILEGEIIFQIGEERVVATAGMFTVLFFSVAPAMQAIVEVNHRELVLLQHQL